jgi:inosine-uridine nucleoside N-ribohydrolase
MAGADSDTFPAGVTTRGHGWRTMHVAWPSLRRLNRLSPDWPSSDAAAEAIIKAAAASGEAGLTVISLGPPTNLAVALRSSPTLARRLRRVVLMGGEVLGGKLDLNFMSDRGAARTVIQSDVPTMIVPIQTCAQAAFTAKHVKHLHSRCCPGAAACALLAKMRLQTHVMPRLVNVHVAPKLPKGSRWHASANLMRGFVPWDTVALLAALNPELFGEWEVHQVEVPPCPEGEPCNGTMVVHAAALAEPSLATVEALDAEGAVAERRRGAHRNVVTVPHLLHSEDSLLNTVESLLCQVPMVIQENSRPWPQYSLGFMKEMALIAGSALTSAAVLPIPAVLLRSALLALVIFKSGAAGAVRRNVAVRSRQLWANLVASIG